MKPSRTNYRRDKSWTDGQWNKFNKAQNKAAENMERKAGNLDKKATSMEKKGKSGASLREAASNLRKGAADLRGSEKEAHLVDQGTMDKIEGCTGAAACGAVGGNDMWVSSGAPNWQNAEKDDAGAIAFEATLGHESLHTGASLEDVGIKRAKFLQVRHASRKGYVQAIDRNSRRFHEAGQLDGSCVSRFW
jgi:hypothetical protein